MSSSPAVWEVLLRSRTEAQRFELEQTGRCWRTLVAIDGPGYHYEFGSLAIMALCHGLRLEGVADRHPAVAQVGVVMGSPVVAVPDGDGVLVQVNGVPWARGDAFEMGREFYALVGFNGAPGAAWDALVAAFGEDGARDVAQITTTHPEDQRP